MASANVDPFTKAWAVANASADSQTNEASLGIEEAAIQTTALPGNLSLTAGRFFGEFGRLSYIHDHEMPFVNRPLVLDQYIGGESRTDGAQLNWLLPTERYLSLSFGAGSGFGGDRPASDPGGYRSARELSFWGRLSTYDDLNDNWQLETGLSAMATPTENATNDEATWTETSRHLAGIDMKLSYVPLENNQFQRFTWGNELLYSDNKYLFNPDGTAGSGDEYSANEGAFGLYSYVDYRWHRQWSGGFLFDYVQEAQDPSSQTFGYSPYLAYSISHWNQLRLQFTHTEHSGNSQLAPDNAIYLQWTWIIGAHEHGWQQR